MRNAALRESFGLRCMFNRQVQYRSFGFKLYSNYLLYLYNILGCWSWFQNKKRGGYAVFFRLTGLYCRFVCCEVLHIYSAIAVCVHPCVIWS